MHAVAAAPTLADVFSQTADATFAVDDNRRIVFVNEPFAMLCGAPPDALLGRPCSRVLDGHTLTGEPFCRQGCCQVFQRQEVMRNFEMVIPCAASDAGWVNIGAFRAPPAWRPAYVVLTLRPINLHHAAARLMHGHAGNPRHTGAQDASPLTRREIQVLCGIAQGKRTRELATQLHISYATLRNHIRHIFAKLGLHSRTELIQHAFRSGLLPQKR
ncbi:MAG: LuxR C-terminal-related transcriptional regulator [Pseudomonadota bacterium]